MPKIKLIVDGGNMKPGPAVSQQLGPMGVNLGQVISDVNEATSGFKGIKVPVELTVDSKTKEYEIKVSSPPVAELLKKELGIEKGSAEPHKSKIGNLAIENIINIAKTKLPNLLAKDLKAAVKLVLGTCVSIGILIENKTPQEITAEVESGVYDSEISGEKTEVSPEKKAKLDSFFKGVKTEQDIAKKEEEAATEAAEAAKAAKAAETPAEGAEPAKEGEPGAAETPAEGAEPAKEGAEKPADADKK
jgi:large subunit ribosomal protein L11